MWRNWHRSGHVSFLHFAQKLFKLSSHFIVHFSYYNFYDENAQNAICVAAGLLVELCCQVFTFLSQILSKAKSISRLRSPRFGMASRVFVRLVIMPNVNKQWAFAFATMLPLLRDICKNILQQRVAQSLSYFLVF